MSDFTPGEWKWWTSNSYKRLVATDGISTTIVLVAYNAADGHPDIDIVPDDMALIEQAPAMFEAMQEFVDRVDKGEVRSKYTYAKFKEILNAATGKEK